MMEAGAISSTRGAKTFACKKVNGDMFIYPITYIEEITRWREDMNVMFEWQEQYLTSE